MKVFLLFASFLLTGCTSELWEHDRFAHHYDPAVPANLELFYSASHKDILVKYREARDDDSRHAHSRSFWLEPNAIRINQGRKPHFVSNRNSAGLVSLPVVTGTNNVVNSIPAGLHAVARPVDYVFTLYDGERRIDDYYLPQYADRLQTVKQVLLTPFALAVDITIVGAGAAFLLNVQGGAEYLADASSGQHSQPAKATRTASDGKPHPGYHRDVE